MRLLSSGLAQGNGRITEVPGRARKEVERVLFPVGQGDAALFFPEKHSLPAFAARLPIVLAADVQHVAQIDQTDLVANGEDPLAPVFVVDFVAGDRFQSPVVAEAIAAERLELKEEEALGRGRLGTVLGLALQDFHSHAEVELALGLFSFPHDEGLDKA